MGFYLGLEEPNALSSEVFVFKKHGTNLSFPWFFHIRKNCPTFN